MHMYTETVASERNCVGPTWRYIKFREGTLRLARLPFLILPHTQTFYAFLNFTRAASRYGRAILRYGRATTTEIENSKCTEI